MGDLIVFLPLLASIASGTYAAVLGKERLQQLSGPRLKNELGVVRAEIGSAREEAQVVAAEVGAIAPELSNMRAEDYKDLVQRMDRMQSGLVSVDEKIGQLHTDNDKATRSCVKLNIAVFVFGGAVSLAITLFVHPA